MSMSYMTRLSLYIMIHALPISSLMLKCMHTNANGLVQRRISIKKFRSLSTYSPTLSWTPKSKIIVELAIHVSFKIFPRDCSSTKNKYISSCGFYFICPVIKFASLYPFNIAENCYNASHCFKYFFKYSKTLFISI